MMKRSRRHFSPIGPEVTAALKTAHLLAAMPVTPTLSEAKRVYIDVLKNSASDNVVTLPPRGAK